MCGSIGYRSVIYFFWRVSMSVSTYVGKLVEVIVENTLHTHTYILAYRKLIQGHFKASNRIKISERDYSHSSLKKKKFNSN